MGLKRVIKYILHKNKKDIEVDFMYLSKNIMCDKVNILLDYNKKVICDLVDRNGIIGLSIMSIIQGDFEYSTLLLEGMEFNVGDNYLYNILYDVKKDRYSLQYQGEYFEKVDILNN